MDFVPVNEVVRYDGLWSILSDDCASKQKKRFPRSSKVRGAASKVIAGPILTEA